MYRIIDNDAPRCLAWLSDHIKTAHCSTAIGLEKAGELIAVVGYGNYNQASIQAHAAIKKGARVTRDFIWFTLYYPFVQLGCKALIAMMDSQNKDSLRLQDHLGYKTHAVIPYAAKNGDLLVRVLYRDHCAWLNRGTQLQKAAA